MIDLLKEIINLEFCKGLVAFTFKVQSFDLRETFWGDFSEENYKWEMLKRN